MDREAGDEQETSNRDSGLQVGTSDLLATLPNRDFIKWLAKDNCILTASIKMGEAQDLPWETTMMVAVKHLVEHNQIITEGMLEFTKRYGPPASWTDEKSG